MNEKIHNFFLSRKDINFNTMKLLNSVFKKMSINDDASQSIINNLDSKGIKKLNSKKEIKPITFQIKGKGSILLDELCRIDYNTNVSSMTFYVSNSLKVDKISLNNERMLDWKSLDYNIGNDQDLVIEDIGFIKVTNEMKIRVYYNESIDVRIRDNLI